VTARNVCQILIAVAPCQVTSLKSACLHYIFLNLEAVLRHGHLEELDEDLLLELDEVARETQQSRSIISRTGQLEEDLLKRHPDLGARILLERQAKIDSIMILNKYSESAPKGSSSYKAGSFHELPDALPMPNKHRRRSSNHGNINIGNTTLSSLKDRPSTSELMFDMEPDERDNRRPSTPARPRYAASPLSGAPSGWTTVSATKDNSKLRVPTNGDTQTPSRSGGASLYTSPDVASRPSRVSRSPPKASWPGLESLPTSKLTMRDIIDHASTARTSNLTLGLSSVTDRRSSGSSLPTNKLSQKERKKLQHQAMQNVDSSSVTKASSPISKGSPWKAIPKAKSPGVEILSPVQSAGPFMPQLTMRQTIANPFGAKDKGSNTPPTESSLPAASKPLHIPSLDVTPSKLASGRSFSASHTPSAPTIQPHSIRHTPKPVRNTTLPANISMADIQNQQHFEKLIATGGGEKRSLSDIQTEQEFQEWWEKESARVQNEEGQAKRQDKSRRQGRGGRRKQGGGKRGGKSAAVAPGSSNARDGEPPHRRKQ